MIDPSTIRYARRQRAYGRLTPEAVTIDSDAYALAEDVIEAGDAPASIIARVDALGFLPLALAAHVCNWIADQPSAEPTFSRKRHRCQRCHRELTDPESIAIGVGPECRKAVGVAA